jgi:hypothetical protein
LADDLARNVYYRVLAKKRPCPAKLTIVLSFLRGFLHPATHHWKPLRAALTALARRQKKNPNRPNSGTLSSKKGINMFD